MLLLVLILVLAAFGLLLIALVTGTAAWAWVSVAVSVAAAGVLVFDWAKRRSAVGDGDVSAPPGGADVVDPPTTMIPALGARTDPATEVFPALRTPGASGGEYSRRDGEGDDQAAPSGSPGQPSGARPDADQSSGDLSLNVTDSSFDHSTEHDFPFVARTGEDVLQGPSDEDATEEKPPRAADETALPTAEARTDVRSSRGDEPDGDGTDSPAPTTSDEPAEASGVGRGTDDAEETTVVRPQVPAPASSDHTETVGLFSPLNPVAPPQADDAEGLQSIPAATQAIPAAASEPGQERVDPAAAAIVASLEDEVLVVDEQPRYHLVGCRTLAGRETIPLPAKEAVEYEFTPCASCSPVRVLAARNRAASNS